MRDFIELFVIPFIAIFTGVIAITSIVGGMIFMTDKAYQGDREARIQCVKDLEQQNFNMDEALKLCR